MSENKGLSSQIELEASVDPLNELPELLSTEARAKSRQKNYELDLRIHSPASLGYLAIEGLESASALVRLAKAKGLDMVGITDYYSGKFVDKVRATAEGGPVSVLPGVVVRAALKGCRDVPLLCLFKEQTTGQEIDELLTALEVPHSEFGKRDFVLTLPFATVLETIELFGGLVIPSRMDKTPYRQTVLPALIEEYNFSSFDLAYQDSQRFFKRPGSKKRFNLWSFSSAYALAQIGSRTAKVKLSEPTFAALKAVAERAGAASSRLETATHPEISPLPHGVIAGS